MTIAEIFDKARYEVSDPGVFTDDQITALHQMLFNLQSAVGIAMSSGPVSVNDITIGPSQ